MIYHKRLYRLFEQHRGAKRRPWMFGHGFAVSVPYSPFWDANFNCEEVKPTVPFEFTKMNLQKSLHGTPLAQPVDAANARDFNAFAFRAHFGEQFGLPNVVLPQYGYRPDLNTIEHSREMIAWTFLHNNMLWPAYIQRHPVYAFWSKVDVVFGMGDTEFHPYWRNGVKTSPDCVKVSYWRKRDREDYLVAVANFSAKTVDATVTLPPAFSRFSQCRDMENSEKFSTGATLSVPVGSYNLRALRFGFGE